MEALINGQAYSYVDITFLLLGVPLPSVSAINYDQTQEKPNHYGTGNKPVSRGRGAIESNGSIDLSMNDVEALRNAAPKGSLLAIPAFDVVIVFGNPQSVQTHVLKAVEFTSDGMNATQGDTDIKRTYDLTIGDVKYR